ncbi:MAG: O-antigen ligase family protein [Anaerolineales bacterium]|nr:O-antigen ligase family protein [Anaerolineales bacterium]MCB9128642.1 O-antigen ligase family protein [Ardenticatenales bacterium]MCB9172874.1 O-antigen ligase family protein [Ardenticatenales bacterium]
MTASTAEGAPVAALRAALLCLLALLMPTGLFMAVAAPVVEETLPLFAAPGIAVGEVVALLVIAAYGQRRTWHWPRVAWPFALLVLLALITTPLALSPRLALFTTVRWAIALLLLLVLSQPNVPWRAMRRCFLLGLALQVAVVVAQVATQGPLGLPGEMALWPEQSGAAVLTVGGQRWLRGYGLTFHPNLLGGFLAAGLVLTLPLLRDLRWRLLWLWLALGLLLTFSRSAWLATALTVPPLALWLGRRWPALRRPLLLTLGSALLFAAIAAVPLAPQLLSRLSPPPPTGTESFALTERAVLTRIAIDFIGAEPLTGVGAGNFAVAMRDAGFAERPQPVHNVTLLLAAELGFHGALVWVALWLLPVATTDLRRSPWSPTLLAAWLALSLIALWDFYPWGLSEGRLLLVTLLAWGQVDEFNEFDEFKSLGVGS